MDPEKHLLELSDTESIEENRKTTGNKEKHVDNNAGVRDNNGREVDDDTFPRKYERDLEKAFTVHTSIVSPGEIRSFGVLSSGSLEGSRMSSNYTNATSLPRKTIAAALFLLISGILCFIAGAVQMVKGGEGQLPLFLVGLVAFIPGSYHTFYLYQVWKGKPGYSFDNVPSFDL